MCGATGFHPLETRRLARKVVNFLLPCAPMGRNFREITPCGAQPAAKPPIHLHVSRVLRGFTHRWRPRAKLVARIVGVSPTRPESSGFHPPAFVTRRRGSSTSRVAICRDFTHPGYADAPVRGFAHRVARGGRVHRSFTHHGTCGRPRGIGHFGDGVSPAGISGDQPPSDGVSATMASNNTLT